MSYYETSATFETDQGKEVTATVRYYTAGPAGFGTIEILNASCDSGIQYKPNASELGRWETHVLEDPAKYFGDDYEHLSF